MNKEIMNFVVEEMQKANHVSEYWACRNMYLTSKSVCVYTYYIQVLLVLFCGEVHLTCRTLEAFPHDYSTVCICAK